MSKKISLEKQITDNALRLKEVDKLILNAFINNTLIEEFMLFSEYIELKKSIRCILMENPSFQIINNDAKDIIKKVRDEYIFETDKLMRLIENKIGEKFSGDKLDDEEISDLTNELFFPWYSPYDYIEYLYEIGSLILGIKVPDILNIFVDEARKCYAFQQYNAVYSLCRTTLEIGVRNICEKKGKFKKYPKGVVDIKRYRFPEMVNSIARGELRQKINTLYEKTSYLIHGNKIIGSDDAKDVFLETLNTIEELYKSQGY